MHVRGGLPRYIAHNGYKSIHNMKSFVISPRVHDFFPSSTGTTAAEVFVKMRDYAAPYIMPYQPICWKYLIAISLYSGLSLTDLFSYYVPNHIYTFACGKIASRFGIPPVFLMLIIRLGHVLPALTALNRHEKGSPLFTVKRIDCLIMLYVLKSYRLIALMRRRVVVKNI